MIRAIGWTFVGVDREVTGKQFGAVGSGPGSTEVIALELSGHEFRRVVPEVDDPASFMADLGGRGKLAVGWWLVPWRWGVALDRVRRLAGLFGALMRRR